MLVGMVYQEYRRANSIIVQHFQTTENLGQTRVFTEKLRERRHEPIMLQHCLFQLSFSIKVTIWVCRQGYRVLLLAILEAIRLLAGTVLLLGVFR
jgi:hypothetical protein